MDEVDLIVTVASWEPRFELGLRRLLPTLQARRLIMYHYAAYARETTSSRESVKAYCRDAGIAVSDAEIRFSDPVGTWGQFRTDLYEMTPTARTALVDITTMPREAVWSILFWLEAAKAKTRFAYHRPAGYGSGWLARDPDEPRFVFKLAGLPRLGKPTALVIVTGYDPDRAAQALRFYEPARVTLALQIGAQFENLARNAKLHRDGVFEGDRVESIEFDAYADDQGYSALRPTVARLVKDHNVVLASFGPKPSAIALYRLQREFEECALAHIHCKEYNTDYSFGIGDEIRGLVVVDGRPESGIAC